MFRSTNRLMAYDPTSTASASLSNSTPNSRAIGRQTSHRRVARWLRLVSLCAGIICVPVPVLAQVNILTNRYDPQRTGANLIGNDADRR